MSLPLFFSDLDQTLLYSNRQIQKHNQSSAGTLVAEQLDGKPLSFMSLQTWKSLVKHSGTNFVFIPTTTRTLRQYRRVVFPDIEITAAIVLNGARILIDGVEDYDWTKKVASDIKKLETHPVRVWEKLKAGLKGDPEVTNVVSADDYFAYVVTKNAHCPNVDAYTTDLALEVGYIRSKQGRKTYLIPKTLNKGDAVAELVKRFGSETSFGSGDSILDFSMIPEVDYFIQPVHGDKTPKSDNLTHTAQNGLLASEDVLNFVTDTLNLE